MEKELFEALGTIIENADKDDNVADLRSLGISVGILQMLVKREYIRAYMKGGCVRSQGKIAYNQELRNIQSQRDEEQRKIDDKHDDREFQKNLQFRGFKLDVMSALIGTMVGIGLGLLTRLIF